MHEINILQSNFVYPSIKVRGNLEAYLFFFFSFSILKMVLGKVL